MVFRVETEWSGGPMGAGLTVMNFSGVLGESTDLDDLLDAVSDFWNTFKDGLATGVSVHVRNTVSVLDTEDGSLLSVMTGASQPTYTPIGSATAYPAGVGCRVRWYTNGIRNDRKVTGTTFIVPLAASNFDTAGTIGSGLISPIQTAANALVAYGTTHGAALCVWSRPTSEEAADGFASTVISAGVPDKVSWLTTRRQ